jgi:hypothetical protein
MRSQDAWLSAIRRRHGLDQVVAGEAGQLAELVLSCADDEDGTGRVMNYLLADRAE